MSKLTLKSGVLSLIALFVPTHAFALLIDFEGLADGTVITDQYSGVTFSANTGFENQITSQIGGLGDNFICTAAVGESINCTEETILTFDALVNNLSFWQVGVNDAGVVGLVDVFENGLLSSTVNLIGYSEPYIPSLVDLTSFSNVSSIRIHGITDAYGIGWDNFEFEVASVPEPSIIALLSLGLIGIGVARRKNHITIKS